MIKSSLKRITLIFQRLKKYKHSLVKIQKITLLKVLRNKKAMEFQRNLSRSWIYFIKRKWKKIAPKIFILIESQLVAIFNSKSICKNAKLLEIRSQRWYLLNNHINKLNRITIMETLHLNQATRHLKTIIDLILALKVVNLISWLKVS